MQENFPTRPPAGTSVGTNELEGSSSRECKEEPMHWHPRIQPLGSPSFFSLTGKKDGEPRGWILGCQCIGSSLHSRDEDPSSSFVPTEVPAGGLVGKFSCIL